VHTLSDNLVVMPPAIVASIVLMQRRGISEQELNNYVEWFCKEVHSRGIKIARTQETSSISVTNALGFLDDVVTKTKKNIFELDLSMNEATINIFLLSYYRNTITHIFFLEAIVLTSLYSFGYEEASVKGVPIEQLKLEAQFLYKLLCKEYVLKDSLANSETLDRYVDTLAIKNVIIREGNSIRSNERKSIYYTFLCSLIWPLVESYWLTSLYLFNLEKLKTSIPMAKLVGQVQWFGEEMI
jgi:glycerol-3-phosphate O-acyltransferase